MAKSGLELLAKDYNSFHNFLKEEGYSHFERGILYSGLAVGMFVPVALTRYTIFPMADSVPADLGYWASSIGVNVFSTAIFRGIPLVYTAGLGFFAGMLPAFGLKKFRERKSKV